jgi:hypothetical protein
MSLIRWWTDPVTGGITCGASAGIAILVFSAIAGSGEWFVPTGVARVRRAGAYPPETPHSAGIFGSQLLVFRFGLVFGGLGVSALAFSAASWWALASFS